MEDGDGEGQIGLLDGKRGERCDGRSWRRGVEAALEAGKEVQGRGVGGALASTGEEEAALCKRPRAEPVPRRISHVDDLL